jgi:hypothetical protein
MSAMASMLLIAGGIVLYIALMAFVLALVTVAGRADEAAEHARALAARSEPLDGPDGALRVGQLRVGLFTAEHAELQGRAARDYEYRRLARERPPFSKNAPWDPGM